MTGDTPRVSVFDVARAQLQTEGGKRLFDSLVLAYERGGAQEVGSLMKDLIKQEKELRDEDSTEGVGGE